MAHVVEHLSLRQLEARYRASHDATEARHLQAIRLLARGRTVLEVAEVLVSTAQEMRSTCRSKIGSTRGGAACRSNPGVAKIPA